MIVDVHYHLIPYATEETLERYAKGLKGWAQLFGVNKEPTFFWNGFLAKLLKGFGTNG